MLSQWRLLRPQIPHLRILRFYFFGSCLAKKQYMDVMLCLETMQYVRVLGVKI